MFPPVVPVVRFAAARGALLFSLQSQGFASINQAGALLSPIDRRAEVLQRRVPLCGARRQHRHHQHQPVQIFAEDRRLSRTRYTSRAMVGLRAPTARPDVVEHDVLTGLRR